MPNITNITPPRVPLTDERTGLISREWYRFFLNLFTLTGSGQSDITLTQLSIAILALELALTELQLAPAITPTIEQTFDLQLAPAANTSLLEPTPGAPSSISIGLSPFTYFNNSVYPVDVMVSNGGISNLEISRDGVTFFNTGSYYGMFALSPSDALRVTYVSTPTMTLIPR